jgi:hypothetical protein
MEPSWGTRSIERFIFNMCKFMTVNFFLAFKSQFAPKCKRWHHGIGTLNGGKPQKKPKI